MSNDYLWVEKYRPATIEETILPKRLKQTFQKIVESGKMPNMLLTGTAGLGKTTVAKALCNELGYDWILINGSDEGRQIDTLRDKIKRFATTVSLTGSMKVVIIDEADYVNQQSFQPALRAFIEEFANNCRFILTCNFKNRIIEPLHSRCSVYEFNTTRKEMATLAAQFMKRAQYILEQEGIEYDQKAVADLIMQHAPDWRRILNELQRTSMSGSVTAHTVTSQPTKFSELFSYLKDKDFKKMRLWVTNNIDTDSSSIIRGIYDEMSERVDKSTIPTLILILAEYQYKAAFVADMEINMVAMMTEIMSNVKFT
jgi:DNA polymerase III delta prime subunit